MEIFIDPEGVKQCAAELDKLSEHLKENMMCIQNTVLSLSGEWQGESERVYEGKILEINNRFNSIYEFLHGYALLMSSVAEQYAEVDNQIKKEFEV